ncbi:hypothetical protein PL332_14790 [Acinetobacter baumannii]|nr:hypothetical protein PL332_14790 [Acinetobacter baumannii]VCX07247.1 hypothetical protein BANRA_01701 [Acinetobacter baumannii]
MSWYSLRQLAKELGMAPNTFKNIIWRNSRLIENPKLIRVGHLNQ